MSSLIDSKRVWLVGAPGSRWSGIHVLSSYFSESFSKDDITPETTYYHKKQIGQDPNLSGHKGYYWGQTKGTESWLKFEDLSKEQILEDLDKVYKTGIPIIKCHFLLRHNGLDHLKELFPDDALVLIYRPAQDSIKWWKDIMIFDDNVYPQYNIAYDPNTFHSQVEQETKYMEDFISRHNLKLEEYGNVWFNKYIPNLTEKDIEQHIPWNTKVVQISVSKANGEAL